MELHKYIYTKPYQTSNNFERPMISRGTGIKVSPHFQTATMCNQNTNSGCKVDTNLLFFPKNFKPQHTPLALLQGLTVDTVKNWHLKKTQLVISIAISTQLVRSNLVGVSPVSRWLLLKHGVPRPTFHSVLGPTCLPGTAFQRYPGRSCLEFFFFVWKSGDVSWILKSWHCLGPWVAAVFLGGDFFFMFVQVSVI